MTQNTDNRQFAVTYRQFRKWTTEIHTSFEAAWERRAELLATVRVTQVNLPTIVE